MVKKTATKKVKVPAKIVIKSSGFDVRRGSTYLGSLNKNKFVPDTWSSKGYTSKELCDIAAAMDALKS